MLIVQLDGDQLSGLLENAFRKVIAEIPLQPPQPEPDTLLTVEGVSKFLHLSIPTIYSKISKKELPVIKNPGSKRCYFSRVELVDYLKVGRQKTSTEIEKEAEKYLEKPEQKKLLTPKTNR